MVLPFRFFLLFFVRSHLFHASVCATRTYKKLKLNSVALVRERTIPTEHMYLCGSIISRGQIEYLSRDYPIE